VGSSTSASLARDPRPAGAPARIALCLLILLAATKATAQLLSDLEPERPVRIEDARPVSYRAFSGSVDWTYNLRQGNLNDHGPGFSLLYGAARSLEVGAGLRYVTRPGRNASRGISSGDIVLHALYGLTTETARFPALAFRAGVEFPTGLDSKGTDLHLAVLATRSFDSFRIHGNVSYTRLGAVASMEKNERFEGVAGVDFVTGRRGLTDTLVVADVAVGSNPVRNANTMVTVEIGARRRIGPQTFLFAGAGSDLTGEPDRARMRLRAGVTHVY